MEAALDSDTGQRRQRLVAVERRHEPDETAVQALVAMFCATESEHDLADEVAA